MDTYGLGIKGNLTVGTDNTYVMGGLSTRMANIYSVLFTGIATSARYADLAEKYSCGEDLPIGTVVSVSRNSEFEVSKCEVDCDPAYIGVVSEKPGFIMGDRKGGLITGLVGKLPVKVKGRIEKSDFIVSTFDGCARAGIRGVEEAYKIGVSLETKTEDDIRLILCIIK